MSATQRVVWQTGTKSFIQSVCFRLLARVRWQYFLITLGCCLTDINQVASGAMASANSYRKRVWSRNVLMSTAGPAAGWPLVASCLAYRASHDIWRWTGCTVALYGMLEWCCADVLTLQEVEPHIYTGIRSLLVRERERARKGQSLLVSDIDCIRTRNNEMLYDFMER